MRFLENCKLVFILLRNKPYKYKYLFSKWFHKMNLLNKNQNTVKNLIIQLLDMQKNIETVPNPKTGFYSWILKNLRRPVFKIDLPITWFNWLKHHYITGLNVITTPPDTSSLRLLCMFTNNRLKAKAENKLNSTIVIRCYGMVFSQISTVPKIKGMLVNFLISKEDWT